jgi:hypothetical protein
VGAVLRIADADERRKRGAYRGRSGPMSDANPTTKRKRINSTERKRSPRVRLTDKQKMSEALPLRSLIPPSRRRSLEECTKALEIVLDDMSEDLQEFAKEGGRLSVSAKGAILGHLLQAQELCEAHGISIGEINYERERISRIETVCAEWHVSTDVPGVSFYPWLTCTPETYPQALACLYAYRLALEWGARRRDMVSTAEKIWCRLAPILYGDRDRDLSDYVKKILRNNRKTVELKRRIPG